MLHHCGLNGTTMKREPPFISSEPVLAQDTLCGRLRSRGGQAAASAASSRVSTGRRSGFRWSRSI